MDIETMSGNKTKLGSYKDCWVAAVSTCVDLLKIFKKKKKKNGMRFVLP